MLNKAEEIKKIYLNDKSLSNREIAKVLGTSRRHVRRTLNPLRKDSNNIKMPKIGLLDIETSPMMCFIWYNGKQYIPTHRIIKEWAILSYSFKYLFSSEIISDVVTPKEATNREDKSIIKGLWNILNESDILIGHNLHNFDVRKANARFLLNGLAPPLPYRVIDTLKVAKQKFAMTAYSLDYLNDKLGLPRKVKTEFQLWVDCVNGDKKALEKMRIYNEQDIRVSEELYIKLRPWISNHPTIGLYIDTEGEVCPNCGNKKLTWEGQYYTTAGRFKSFRCNNCKAIGRSRYSDLTKEERKKLVSSVAR